MDQTRHDDSEIRVWLREPPAIWITGVKLPPQAIVGIDFDEPFFDSVINRAGGYRLELHHKLPPNTQHVDYMIQGWALELKILVTDPLDAKERQARLTKFFAKHFPRGYLWVTAHRQAATLTGDMAQELWERYLGGPTQDRLDSAAGQIADTRTFVPNVRFGGVMIVNAGGHSLDWQSFFKLCGHYQQRFAEIDAVFPFSGIPANTAGGIQIHFCGCSKKKQDPDADALFDALNGALSAEIAHRIGRPLQVNEININAPGGKAHFRLGPAGLRNKRSE